MNKKEVILAAMAPAKSNKYSPVQIQKLLFLMDKAFSAITGVPILNFQPYYYGPFDKSIIDELEQLRDDGLILFTSEGTYTSYSLSSRGQVEGEKILYSMPEKPREYIKLLSEFVRKLSFAELVSVISKDFPDMKITGSPEGPKAEKIAHYEYSQSIAEAKNPLKESHRTIEIPKMPK
jgi:uncharacterized protein YwgA